MTSIGQDIPDPQIGVAAGTRAGDPGPPGGARLEAGAMSLPSVVMQSVANIAPAIGALLTVPYIVGLAGPTGTLAFLLGFLLMLSAAVPLAELARELPSAGGYYTYLSRVLHPRIGFLATWAWGVYTPATAAFASAIVGSELHSTLQAKYGINYPWWITVPICAAAIYVLASRDVRVSSRWLLVFGGIEIAIIVMLALWGFASPGPGGFSVAVFNPAGSLSAKGLYLAVVFAVFALTGWEAAGPAAEEIKEPRKAVPRALIAATIITGLFFVLVSWGLSVGWGLHRIGSFGTSVQAPAIVLAQKYWSTGWLLVLFALINSLFAVSLACNNVSTRMWFAMARSGSLPRQMAYLHPKHKTPLNAIRFQALVTLVLGLGVGFWIGPVNEFFLFGLALTITMVVVYALGNVAVFRYFWIARHPNRRFFVHVVLPAISTVAIVWVGYKSLVPLPAKPVGWAPLALGIWVLIGVAVLIAMRVRGREQWLHDAGKTLSEL